MGGRLPTLRLTWPPTQQCISGGCLVLWCFGGEIREKADPGRPAVPRPRPPPALLPSPAQAAKASLAASGRRLVDLIRALGRVGGAHRDGRADLLELEFVGGGTVLKDVSHVLGITGVPNTLDAYALGGVVALLGGCERLIELAALTFLLGLLGYLGYGRDGRQGQHRQERRQQHHLPQLLLLLSRVFRSRTRP